MNKNLEQTTGITLASSFNFNDKVIINPLNIEGRVISFQLKGKDCLNIEVRYFSNNELKTDYFFEEELKLAEEKVIEKEPNLDVSSAKNNSVISYGRSTYGKSSLSQQIIDIFSINKDKAYSSSDLAKCLGSSTATIRSCIKQLKDSNIIKIVDFKEFDGSRPLIILYQLKSSPLEELSTKTEEDGYETITNFYHSMKEKGKTTPCISIINRLVKEKNLKGQPMLYQKGLVRGYKIEDLEKICLKEHEATQLQLPLDQTEDKRKVKKESRNTREEILSTLEKEPTKGMTTLELAELLNLSKTSVQNSISFLKSQRKVKIVDLVDTKNSSGFYSLKYQVASSSLPTVRISKDSKRYCNLKAFYEKYKNQSVPKAQADEILKKRSIQEVPLMHNGRVSKAYSISDLKKVLIKRKFNENNELVLTKKQENKFSEAIKNFFKKKEKFDQDFISF